ncbi:succinate dehydrogenase/fumarate reductase cytochrome b subunit [Oceanidesulfovibrio marinus]|uniref:Succinate dehydrogenase/fumarate reductase cytochrome b subunit n=2 Tax=Oceanidesulfovibrio marinus TaxID=370038 RepID=A0A6P1ZDQ4_9BACT|nr:succinate dehydrogenase/fumarate reductase cytochrome b subunit [Oceanidesulfovibrio marinus]QJT11322.1 succinate dehydrogenase/fumarate reductase cytochrome b subunit [Oceanidesulfovibrio marinus]TVM31070.1 succinate dehydrogenase/fumarate reductase cytochrome b subunit [Oceanidesulfovibrio marinus]
MDSAMPAKVSSRTAAYMDWAQMLTGAILILFMWSHMILVSSVIIGPGAMNALAVFFESTGLAQVGGPIIGVLFLFHFVLAARKVPFRLDQQKVFLKHSRMLHHGDTWLWVIQAVSAMIILIMGAAHMWVVLTDLPITAAKSAARMQHWPWLIFYLCLLPLVELHVSIGFYRIGVKWGFIKRSSRTGGKKLERGLLIVFLVIGFLTIIRFLTLTAAAS